jgi:hypothetical protein
MNFYPPYGEAVCHVALCVPFVDFCLMKASYLSSNHARLALEIVWIRKRRERGATFSHQIDIDPRGSPCAAGRKCLPSVDRRFFLHHCTLLALHSAWAECPQARHFLANPIVPFMRVCRFCHRPRSEMNQQGASIAQIWVKAYQRTRASENVRVCMLINPGQIAFDVVSVEQLRAPQRSR